MINKVSLTILLISIITLYAKAQIRLTDANGQPITIKKYAEVEGSPYLYNDWKKGSVKLSNGSVYDNELKFDLVENQLLFKSASDETLAFSEPVKEFTLFVGDEKIDSKLYRNGYGNSKIFYEVLVDGKYQLLKLHRKSIEEKSAYGATSSVKEISDALSYYIYKSESIIQIRKDKKAILSALGDKQAELGNYIKTNNIKFKDDNDIAKLIIYYNSI